MNKGVYMTSGDMTYIQRVLGDLNKTHIANNAKKNVNASNVIFDIKVVVRDKNCQTLGEIEYVINEGFVFFPSATQFEGYVAPKEAKPE